MFASREDLIKNEKYLKLNEFCEFAIDFSSNTRIIDFHTHLSNIFPIKASDPNTRGRELKYPTLPTTDKMNLHIPYWTESNPNVKLKGLAPILKFSSDGLKILNDMVKGGTFENCFQSQMHNGIDLNVLLPISTKSCDRSISAYEAAKQYPDKFVWFCSVHPYDADARDKIFRYKKLGAKGLKLKVTDLELKNNFEPLISLFGICYEAHLPVLLHTGSIIDIRKENVSGTMWKLLNSTRVELFGELLSKLPKDFTFIFGHSGVQQYKLVAEYMRQFPACYTEVSSQSAESIQYLIEHAGSERILYGSDWPAYPQAITLSRVLLATEGDNQARDNILYNNAERILNYSEDG